MIELRNATINDLNTICNLEEKNFSNEKYSYITLKDFIDNVTKLDIVRVLTKEDKIIGYIIYRINDDLAEIFKICIDSFYRRMGYGALLLDDFLNYIRFKNINKIMLEVRSDNLNAISFYKAYGFIELDRRLSYYKNPECDAIIMQNIL